VKRYNTAFEIHQYECPVAYGGEGKGSCLECQMAKVCNGLVSGRYSVKQGALAQFKTYSYLVTVHPDGGKEESQVGISPRMLKTLIGQGHSQFAGLKQQDAHEFLMWLLSRIKQKGKATGHVLESLLAAEQQVANKDSWGGYADPLNCFKFVFQQRIQCLGCGGVKYRVDENDNINISISARLKQFHPLRLIC
jgi:ubiquitin carboxyl-terminal hydrolase 5/13